MSYTPLEQNGLDLEDVFEAINNLPEYDPPEITYDFFSLYNAVKIAEFTNTINLATDTDFESVTLTNDTWTTIRSGTSASAEKSVEANFNTYVYVATYEWYLVPKYTAQRPSTHYFGGKAGVGAVIFSNGGASVEVKASKNLYVDGNGVISEKANTYGITWYSGAFVSSQNNRIYLTEPSIGARPNASLASIESLQTLDAENTNMVIRQRVYRCPHDQFVNLMQTMCADMIDNESF